MKRNVLLAAAVGGGLYWASKQPGGIRGMWDRFSPKLKRVQDSETPLEAFKEEFLPDSDSEASFDDSYARNDERIEPVSAYNAAP